MLQNIPVRWPDESLLGIMAPTDSTALAPQECVGLHTKGQAIRSGALKISMCIGMSEFGFMRRIWVPMLHHVDCARLIIIYEEK